MPLRESETSPRDLEIGEHCTEKRRKISRQEAPHCDETFLPSQHSSVSKSWLQDFWTLCQVSLLSPQNPPH